MKEQNGITLIALIITIIVMLILLGVTVATALNGGLFTTAEGAGSKTQMETEREILQSAVVGALNEELKIPNADALKNNLPEGWRVIGTSEEGYIATSPNVNEFNIDVNGTIKEPSTGDLALLEKYFIGKDFMTLNPDWQYGGKFEDDPETEINENENITFLNMFEEANSVIEINFYVKYNNKGYKVASRCIGDDYAVICNKVELVYEPQRREGEKVAYDSNNDGIDEEWMIIYDNGDNVEMISTTNMGEKIKLGYNDTEAQTPGDVDKDGSENTNLDKAIYSYNNAVTRLNSYCESLITKEDANRISVRSVGSNPSNPSSENITLYTSDNLANLAEGKYNGIGKSRDLNLEQDLIRMSYYGIAAIGERYLMASHFVDDNSDRVDFGLYGVYSDGYYECENLWGVTSSGGVANDHNFQYGVRPIIKMKKSDTV